MKYILQKSIVRSITGRLGGYIYYQGTSNWELIRIPYIDKPPSSAQEEIRLKFKEVDKAFIALGLAQRMLWRHAATKRKKYTNYAYFMSLNLKRVFSGEEILLLPPN